MPVIDSILDKLEEEKYLTIQEIKNYHTTGFSIDKKYKISYKGYILVNHEGGYYQKIKKGKADANKKVLYEKIVTIGAGLGGIYVCIQIVGVVLDLFHLEIDILLIKKLLHSLVLFLLFPCNYI
jgi:hypothetical protein